MGFCKERRSPSGNERETHAAELDGIVRMMQKELDVGPPTGLEDRVMERMRSYRPSPWEAVREVLLKPRAANIHPFKALRSPVSAQECSFYFIMVGYFYAILGVVLMFGYRDLGAGQIPQGWVRLQPHIALLTAVCMGAIGLYLLKDGKVALRIARIVSFVYLGFAVLNGIVVSLEWNIPLSAFTTLVSVLIGVPTGFFLIRTVQNYGKHYAKT